MGYRKLFQVDLEEGNNCIVGGARQPPSANKRNLFFPPGKKKEKKSKSQGDEEKKNPVIPRGKARQGKQIYAALRHWPPDRGATTWMLCLPGWQLALSRRGGHLPSWGPCMSVLCARASSRALTATRAAPALPLPPPPFAVT